MPTPAPTSTPIPLAAMGLQAHIVGTTVVLTWLKSGNATGYAVDRTSKGTTWAQVGTTAVGVLAWTDTTCTPGVSYSYRVRATIGAASSPPGEYVSATVPSTQVTPKPTPPVVTPVPTVTSTTSVTPVPVPPVVAPTPSPTGTQPMMVGSPGVLKANVVVGMAPRVVVFDVSALVNVLVDNLAWDLPGATVVDDPKTGVPITGAAGHATSLIAAEYQTEGAYVATCTATHPDGSTTVFSASVTLTPDARPPIYWDAVNGNDANAGTSATSAWKSAENVRAAIAKSSARVRILSDATLPSPAAGQPGYFNPASETIIEGVRDATGKAPTLTVGPFTGLFVSGGRTGILTRDLTITSVGTPLANGNVVGAAEKPPSTNRSSWVASFGTDTAVVRCAALCLKQGFQQFGGDLTVLDCSFPAANTLAGQGILATGTTGRLLVLAVDSDGTFAEAISRTDGNISRFAVSHCSFNQYPARWLPAAPKPGFDGRSGGGVVADCYFHNCPLSFSQSIPSTATVPGSIIGNIRVRRSTFVADQPLIFTTWVDVKSPAFNVTVDGNTYSKSVPSFVTPSGNPTNVLVTGNVGN